MKCLNCDAEASFKVKNDSSEDQFFCEKDLPEFLTERVFEHRLTRLDSGAVEHPLTAPKAKKKKEESAPTPEPTPEPVVEEKVEEAPAVE